jgi:hypothetical protein
MTARKTGPHLRRGPKPKPKPEKRSRGRPKVPLREHPDRYTVARFDVADWWLRQNVKGNRTRAGMVLGADKARQRQDVSDMRKAADSLRTMARRYRKPDDMVWRKAIGTAAAFTIQIAADPAGNPNEFAFLRDQILYMAGDVGEEEWARRELLPLLSLLPLQLACSPPSQLEDRDQLMLLASLIVSVGWATAIGQWMARAAADDARPAQPEIEGIFRPT